MRIIFMGTPEFSVPYLERLVELGYQVVAVYTQPDRPTGRGRGLNPSPVKQFALSTGLAVYQPESLRSEETLDEMADLSPDLIFIVAYGLLLPQRVIDLPSKGCLNVHPSLLPRHRGPSPIAGAILSGDTETGVTIMLIDAGMDSGPILSQESLNIDPTDTTTSLSERLRALGLRMMEKTIPLWLKSEIAPRPQDESLVTVTRMARKEDGEMDWSLPAIELWRRVRAYHPWPGVYTRWKGRILKIVDAMPLEVDTLNDTGLVLSYTDSETLTGQRVGVQTGSGLLELRVVQLEGGKTMTASDFVRGHKDFLGSILTS